jgi:hypothetical protein
MTAIFADQLEKKEVVGASATRISFSFFERPIIYANNTGCEFFGLYNQPIYYSKFCGLTYRYTDIPANNGSCIATKFKGYPGEKIIRSDHPSVVRFDFTIKSFGKDFPWTTRVITEIFSSFKFNF